MEDPIFANFNELNSYVKKNNIQNIEIRFLDNKFILRSFCINANLLSFEIFTANYFKFNSYNLLPLNLKRVFKDPFLPNSTLIFFTNLIEHANKLTNLQVLPIPNFYQINFYIENKDNNFISYPYCCPPFDSNRTIRDEIALIANKSDIIIKKHFYEDNGCNVLIIENKNNLKLLDNIEKIKYIILMVSSIFNQKVDLSKGIFSQSSLLFNANKFYFL